MVATPSEAPYGGITAVSRRVTALDLVGAKQRGERWPMITTYDALTAELFDSAGIPVLLVGDSAAMVVQGHHTTLPITVDDMLPLVAAVVRGSTRAMVVADMPFGSYQASPEQALESATRFIKEGGAHAVKLEGGARVRSQVQALVEAGIPVMGHIGLTPQSVNVMGGYRVQGRGSAGEAIIGDAKALEAAGAFAIVLEVMPAELAQRITSSVDIPTVGIGAGNSTDAQVLVWQDLMGLTPPPHPRFLRPYADLRGVMTKAVSAWAHDVVAGQYPSAEQDYQ
ncbi:MAG TPA: 3-methyl-2-oxobutanoate hydroxymethyltransferase [Actinobacteria bacterium]|nr:3-methyl-2-oxobutanoate hydroxymethyltransferase [Actinomycetota bacterium]